MKVVENINYYGDIRDFLYLGKIVLIHLYFLKIGEVS